MYKDLSHLDDRDVEELMTRYYSEESAKKLVSDYCLTISASNLYKFFPPEEFTNYICESCGCVLVANRQSKSNANSPRLERDLFCPSCKHKPYTSCKCTFCQEVEIKKNEECLKNVLKSFGQRTDSVDFSEISFLEKVYLGTLCRAYLKENLREFIPKYDGNAVLAPLEPLEYEIYKTLIDENVICVSPQSEMSAFSFNDENIPVSFNIYRVMYNPNLLLPQNKQSLFLEILNPTYYSDNYKEEALVLWKQIAIAECIQYLLFSFNKINFDFSPGEKTETTFEILLQDYSVSQIYGIIWRAIADASKLYLEKGLSKKHAANSVINACARYAERAKPNGWELSKYKRIKELPQSELSIFLFNRVLKIGENGFDMPPIEL